MGYYYNFTGELKFNRPLTQEEIDEYYNLYSLDINVTRTTLAIYEETRFSDIKDDLIQLSNEFFKPKGVYFEGELYWEGDERDDLGYYDIDSENGVFNSYIGKVSVNYYLQS